MGKLFEGLLWRQVSGTAVPANTLRFNDLGFCFARMVAVIRSGAYAHKQGITHSDHQITSHLLDLNDTVRTAPKVACNVSGDNGLEFVYGACDREVW